MLEKDIIEKNKTNNNNKKKTILSNYDITKINLNYLNNLDELMTAIETDSHTDPILCPKCFRPLFIKLYPSSSPNNIEFICEKQNHLSLFSSTEIINSIFSAEVKFRQCHYQNCEKIIEKGWYCFKCETIFCDECKNKHLEEKKNLCKNHLIEREFFSCKCEKHPQREFNYFCIDDNKNLCTNCVKSHRNDGHKIIDFSENNLIFEKNEIEDLQNNIKEMKKKMNKFISSNKINNFDKNNNKNIVLTDDEIKEIKLEIFICEKIIFSFDENDLPNYQQLINIYNIKDHIFLFQKKQKSNFEFLEFIEQKNDNKIIKENNKGNIINNNYNNINEEINKNLIIDENYFSMDPSIKSNKNLNYYRSLIIKPTKGTYPKPDYSYKILLLGMSGVGKTQIISRIVRDKFYSSLSSIGSDIDFIYLRMKVKNKNKVVKVSLFDTAGQERFCALASGLVKGSDGIIFVYDVVDERSFDDYFKWYDIVCQNINIKNVKMIILGNKKDLIDDEEYKNKHVDVYYPNQIVSGKNNGISFFQEVSCKDDKEGEILRLFIKLIQLIMANDLKVPQDNLRLSIDNLNNPIKKKKCF